MARHAAVNRAWETTSLVRIQPSERTVRAQLLQAIGSGRSRLDAGAVVREPFAGEADW